MDTKLNVLIVEDVETDAELLERELIKSGIRYISKVVDNRSAYLEALSSFEPAIILSDYGMPSFNGMQALLLREKMLPDVPFILVTGANNEEIAVECMKAGADDYILKNNLTRLGHAFKSALDKKAIVRANKESDEKLRILSRAVEQNPALILITDTNGNIEYVNPKFTQTTGYAQEEVLGKNPRLLKSGNQNARLYSDLWNTVLSGNEWTGELLNRKKNGDLFWEFATISPLLNPEGDITHLVGIMEDITEKRRMLVDLIVAKEKAEAGDKLKTAFIKNISHEVRTPLSTIVGFIDMLQNPDISDETRLSFNQIIKKSSNRLLNTITNYMDISIIVSGNMEVHNTSFSLDKLLEEVKAEFKEACKEKHIKLTIQKPERDEDIYLNSDPELLHKIWYQLLSNAVKFTSKGEIKFGVREQAEGLSFFVSDTGIGIEADKSQLIFDYFMQADISQTRIYEGSGLGLSIARDLVKLLGGNIYVESVKNEGTTFLFTLTENKGDAVAERPGLKILKAGLQQNPLILVAEDDDFNFKYLDIILKRANYLVVRAVNGLEAIDICRKNKDVNLVLMDMKMPKMGGLDATREIRKFMPDLPVIALTAYVSPVDENEAVAAGCNEFVSKPVNRPKLLGLMQKILGNQDWERDSNV